jgi:hypothetical protein
MATVASERMIRLRNEPMVNGRAFHGRILMRLTICLTAALALVACSKPAEAPPAADNSAADANATAAVPAAFQLNETTWTFKDKNGKDVEETIDANGNYVATSGSKEVDHGTGVMKDDKACFTSAVDKKGEVCWTTKPVDVGQSMDTVSDKGEKLTVTRVAYVPAAPAK